VYRLDVLVLNTNKNVFTKELETVEIDRDYTECLIDSHTNSGHTAGNVSNKSILL